MFPTDDRRTRTPWTNFMEAQAAFDKVKPHVTTVGDLRELGFDPHTTPNVKILTYLDLINRFIPNNSITKADLPPDVALCIEAKECCRAYELNLDLSHSYRYGNLCLDVFGFKKKTHTTGWQFKALIILKDDVVRYKISSGEPFVDRYEKKVKPLGPFQELDSLVTKVPGMM